MHAVLVEVVQEVRLLTLVHAEWSNCKKLNFFQALVTKTKLEILPGKHVLRVKESPNDPHQLHGRAHVWSSD